jgi:hypothetical protein
MERVIPNGFDLGRILWTDGRLYRLREVDRRR